MPRRARRKVKAQGIDDAVRHVPISHLHHMRTVSTCPILLVSLNVSHPLSSDLSCALVHSTDVCDYTRWLKVALKKVHVHERAVTHV